MANTKLINKLLFECLKATSEGKMNKAQRLYAKCWHDSWINQYKALNEADESAEDEVISDEFSDAILGDYEGEESNKFDEAQIALDELEEKVEEYFDDDEAEDVKQKLDDARNAFDELAVVAECDGEDCDESEKEDEAKVIVDDIKTEFESKLGELPEDVADIFVEIEGTFEGDEAPADEPADEPAEDGEPAVEEGVEDMNLDAEEVEEPAEEEPAEPEAEDDNAPVDDEELRDIMLDLHDSQKQLEDKFDEIIGEKEQVDEEWTKLKVERNGAKNEEEGVKKQSMNISKVKKLTDKPEMGVAKSNSEGNSAKAPIKGNIGRENKGLNQYEKVKVDNKG